MLSVSSPRSSSSQSSQWVAPPAASWTSEEINMIQEMFLSDEKAIQIRDISISGGKLSVAEDPLAVSVEQCAATSMLLSPIGADNDFLQQFMVDEKDAMAAFFVEAIDPFKNVPDSNASHEPAVNSAATGPSDGRPVEHVLAKLRAKVDGLSRLYYSRCMDVSSADDSSINKVKLVLAIERLQRVIQGLSHENAQLKTDTTSCSQRSELLLQGSSDDTSELKQLSHSIDESVCTAAVEEGMHLALNCSMDGEVLKDYQDEHGWGYKSVVSQDGVFTYSLTKSYPKEVNMHDVMQKTWANVTSSDSFSCIYYGSIKAQLVKEIGKETVIMYDMTNHDATRVDRVLAVLFRKKLPNGYLLGARSINMRPAGASDQTNVRWMDCTTWQRYECNADGGFSVTSGGQLSYPSRADIDFMAVEILCLHLRWENRVVGAQLTM
ncbi:hypothetical protein PF005_g16430 [Phytophthora fragariae]|nr:hypothetical protein PF003_g11895 [Phytophthora fragariae]KAE8932339.1 hypothetical protein PF009_g17620 [Phytophthora fragariae]KAE9102107.1 hypothetical protein PF010_g14226 [Phytophthora fragariae]KAE9131689.1 hypothetical protein PF006_g15442 [Phytophthora fragariae]KAE9197662.1 hypothetical protein PF005_g16430 [Phytophthora fragariae]